MILPAATCSSGSNPISKSELRRSSDSSISLAQNRELHSVVSGQTRLPDELVMGEKNGSSALMRIEQFNGNETEQVWEAIAGKLVATRQRDHGASRGQSRLAIQGFA